MKSRIEPNVITYSATISTCEKIAQWEHALELFDELKRSGIRPNVITYSAVAIACHNAGAETEARRMYRESLDRGLKSH